MTLDGIDGLTLKAIVDYCYDGHIDITAENADNILHAASSMEFPAIEEMVGRFWWSQLGIQNCIEILEKAEQYCLMDLWQKALQFFGANFHKLPLDELLNVGERILRKMLAFDEIAVTEEQIFDFVVTWVQRNEKERAEFVPAILKMIRLKHFTPKVSSIQKKAFHIRLLIHPNFSSFIKGLRRFTANMTALDSSLIALSASD